MFILVNLLIVCILVGGVNLYIFYFFKKNLKILLKSCKFVELKYLKNEKNCNVFFPISNCDR